MARTSASGAEEARTCSSAEAAAAGAGPASGPRGPRSSRPWTPRQTQSRQDRAARRTRPKPTSGGLVTSTMCRWKGGNWNSLSEAGPSPKADQRPRVPPIRPGFTRQQQESKSSRTTSLSTAPRPTQLVCPRCPSGIANPSFEVLRPALAVDVSCHVGSRPPTTLLPRPACGTSGRSRCSDLRRHRFSAERIRSPRAVGRGCQWLVPLDDLRTGPPSRDQHRRHRLAPTPFPAGPATQALGRAGAASRRDTHVPRAAGECRRCTRSLQRLPGRASGQPLRALGIISLVCADTGAVRFCRPCGRPALESRRAACPRACAHRTDTGDRSPPEDALPGERVAASHQGSKLQRQSRPGPCAAQREAKDGLAVPESPRSVGRNLHGPKGPHSAR